MQAGRDRKKLLNQINVTPLVDVMLVLLIIFMVTAPMMQEGIDVNLPKVRAAGLKAADEPIIVTIDRSRKIFLNDRQFKPAELREKLRAINSARGGITVLLRADETVPYGHVMGAMAEIRAAGIEKVGMVTEPVDMD